jgi:glutamyl/glutaminyl-tRNA synthetase
VLHHPLLRKPDGAKLSKASRDTSLRERRAAGASPAELFGEAAFLCGLQATASPIPADEISALFDA